MASPIPDLTPRRVWFALGACAAIALLVQLPGPHATAWHFFELAVDLLTGAGPVGEGGGLALYADHPELQFGPLSILLAAPFTILGASAGKYAVMVTASLLGVALVRLLADLLPDRSQPPPLLLVTGLVVVVTWADIAVRTAHIDDAIALAAAVAALRWTRRNRPTAAMVMFAVAAAAKPWAVMFVPLAMLPIRPGSWRRPIIAAGAAVATWLPFIVFEPDTLDTSGFAITNDPTSSLRALGIDAATTPDWVRPAQLVGGFLLVTVLTVLGRWPAGMLAAVSWRLLLDPGVHRYYTAGFVVGALLVEHRIRPGRPPWYTIAAAIVLEVTAIPDIPVGPGQAARLAVLAGGLAVAAFAVIPGPTVDPGLRSTHGAPMTSE